MSTLANVLWVILAIVIVVWLVGLVLSWGGPLIHLLLLVALVILVVNLLTGRRSA